MYLSIIVGLHALAIKIQNLSLYMQPVRCQAHSDSVKFNRLDIGFSQHVSYTLGHSVARNSNGQK